MCDGFEPHDHVLLTAARAVRGSADYGHGGVGEVYPGWWEDWRVREGAIPVPHQDHPRDPY